MPTCQGNPGLACQGNPGLAFLLIRFSKSVGRPNEKRMNPWRHYNVDSQHVTLSCPSCVPCGWVLSLFGPGFPLRTMALS